MRLLLLVCLGAALPRPSSAASVAAAPTVQSEALRIRAAAAPLVLDVAQGSVADGATVLAYPWHYTTNQQWYVQPMLGGAVWLVNVASGKGLAVDPNAATAPVQTTLAPTMQQAWLLLAQDDGSWGLQVAADGACLSLEAVTPGGATATMLPCKGDPNQRFFIELAPTVCDGVTCSGHGTCYAPTVERARCACDPNFHGEGPACVVDPPPAAGRRKRGAGTWAFAGQGRALADLAPAWVYSWGPSAASLGAVLPSGVEFVPMIWGSRDFNAAAYATAKSSGTTLLGINEPDHCDQACLSVEDVLAVWPQLMATGMRLGSPAPAGGAATDGTWLPTFMDAALTLGYSVDFVAVHYYAGNFDAQGACDDLADYLQAVYERYRLPIWLTEFAMIGFDDNLQASYPTLAQQAAFAAAATAMLDKLSYVERYAWFSLPPTGGGTTALYDSDGSPTAVADAYRWAPSP